MALPDSIQLDILKRLTAHLAGIVPPFYDEDLSLSVFRGRTVHGDEAVFPFITVAEHLTADVNVQTAGENRIERVEDWILLIQGFVKSDPNNPTDKAYQLKAMVEHRLARLVAMNPSTGDPMYPDEYLVGVNGITSISIGPGVVSGAVRTDVSSNAFFYLPLGISIAMNVSDPFV